MPRLAAFIAFLLVLASPAALADDEHPRPFDGNYDAMDAVEAARQLALLEDKRLLIIFGANWCHDSRGLAHHFQDPELAQILAANYVVTHVDVGWRDRNHDVMRRYGVAAIYGTPTVLVVDPERDEWLNRHSSDTWTTAASRPIEEVTAYFSRWTTAQGDTDSLIAASVIYQSMLTEIEVFEAEEGERLALAYVEIGAWRQLPGNERPENFDKLEDEVETWRRRTLRQVRRLRGNALDLAEDALAEFAAGAEINLDLIAAFDQTDPDLPLRIQPHQSDRW